MKSGFAEGWSLLGQYTLSQWCQSVSSLGKYFVLLPHSWVFFPPPFSTNDCFHGSCCQQCAGGRVFYLGTNCGCLGISCYDCFSNGYKPTPRQPRRRSASETTQTYIPNGLLLWWRSITQSRRHANTAGNAPMWKICGHTPRRPTRLKLINAAVFSPEQQ